MPTSLPPPGVTTVLTLSAIVAATTLLTGCTDNAPVAGPAASPATSVVETTDAVTTPAGTDEVLLAYIISIDAGSVTFDRTELLSGAAAAEACAADEALAGAPAHGPQVASCSEYTEVAVAYERNPDLTTETLPLAPQVELFVAFDGDALSPEPVPATIDTVAALIPEPRLWEVSLSADQVVKISEVYQP